MVRVVGSRVADGIHRSRAESPPEIHMETTTAREQPAKKETTALYTQADGNGTRGEPRLLR